MFLVKFVEMALAQELLLENCGRSLPYLYYMAVSFYLRGRYHEAISHLEEAVKDYGKVSKTLKHFKFSNFCLHI